MCANSARRAGAARAPARQPPELPFVDLAEQLAAVPGRVQTEFDPTDAGEQPGHVQAVAA